MSSKQLDSLPPRILRFRLRLMRYHFNIKHVPGKLMYTADTLSRASTSVPGTDCEVLQDNAELFAAQVIAHLPASKARMDVYRSSQTSDPVTSAVIKYCRFGWPEKHRLQSELRVYWSLRGENSIRWAPFLWKTLSHPPRLCKKRQCRVYIRVTKEFRGASLEQVHVSGGQESPRTLSAS